MARANFLFYGFRPFSGADLPKTNVATVASGYATALVVGQPIKRLNNGTVDQCAAGEGITGIITKILQYRNSSGVVVTNSRGVLPASTTWTAHQDRSIVEFIPARPGNLFEVCGNTAFASETTGIDANSLNCDHIYPASAVDTALGIPGVLLDTSSPGTGTAQWRLRGLVGDFGGPRVQNDPTLVNQIWVVEANEYLDVVPGGSATGV